MLEHENGSTVTHRAKQFLFTCSDILFNLRILFSCFLFLLLKKLHQLFLKSVWHFVLEAGMRLKLPSSLTFFLLCTSLCAQNKWAGPPSFRWMEGLVLESCYVFVCVKVKRMGLFCVFCVCFFCLCVLVCSHVQYVCKGILSPCSQSIYYILINMETKGSVNHRLIDHRLN